MLPVYQSNTHTLKHKTHAQLPATQHNGRLAFLIPRFLERWPDRLT